MNVAGVSSPAGDSGILDVRGEDEGDDEEYQPTPEDLEMDEEEPIGMADELVDVAISIMDS